MDETPFLDINILDIKDAQVAELKKFHKSSFDIDEVINAASELKYSNEIKRKFNKDLTSPSDEFVRFFVSDIYSGRITQQIIEKFRPIVKKALNQYISETLNDRIKNVLATNDEEHTEETADNTPIDEPIKKVPKIVTTQEELEAYFIIKNLLKDTVSMEDITIKDTENYMNILYKSNTRKWICRLFLTNSQKAMTYMDNDKKTQKIQLESIYDLEKYKSLLTDIVKRFV